MGSRPALPHLIDRNGGCTDTGSSALASLQAWMMEWIPIGAALLIIACALGWIAHLVRADFAVRCVVGLIVVGSALYLVGLFGIS